MKNWWQQLNLREQKLVASMSVVIAIFILYSVIWQPINNNLSKTKKKLERQQQLLIWVEENTARYKQASITGQKSSNASLTSIVNRTANQQKISIARMQPQSKDLQVWIDEVSFSDLLQWLALLSNREGLQVKNIDISNTEKSGVVRIRRLVLGK
jgi:general secretion pathway protein M